MSTRAFNCASNSRAGGCMPAQDAGHVDAGEVAGGHAAISSDKTWLSFFPLEKGKGRC